MAGIAQAIQLIQAYVKALESTAASLPRFAEYVKNFVATLGTAVDDLVASFDKADGNRLETTSEARAICHELRQIMVHSNAFMAKVDNFAWHAKRQDRQRKVQDALRQEPPQLQPLKEYILQLARSLGQAEEAYVTFNDSFDAIISRLNKVVDDCSKNLTAAEKRELAVKVVGGIAGAGAAVGGAAIGAGLAGIAAIPTLGIGPIVILALSGAGSIAAGAGIAGTAAGVAHLIVKHYQNVAAAIQALTSQIQLITSVAMSIETTVSEIHSELENIQGLTDDVESTYEMPESLLECVELLFERLTEFGTTCSDCRQDLKEKKNQLNTAIDNFFTL